MKSSMLQIKNVPPLLPSITTSAAAIDHNLTCKPFFYVAFLVVEANAHLEQLLAAPAPGGQVLLAVNLPNASSALPFSLNSKQ
ncbi:MAG: hypothetical protein LBF83_06110 [Spirochaetaceae bacterium]|jgi:hypothetical protein|nr:hypothetical protein [Spirochaetaceae bacterium]